MEAGTVIWYIKLCDITLEAVEGVFLVLLSFHIRSYHQRERRREGEEEREWEGREGKGGEGAGHRRKWERK